MKYICVRVECGLEPLSFWMCVKFQNTSEFYYCHVEIPIMFFDKRRYQVIVGNLLSPMPQLGDASFTVNCFVYLEGQDINNPKVHDENDRSRLRLELELLEIDDMAGHKAAAATKPRVKKLIEGLQGRTSRTGVEAVILESVGLRFDLGDLHLPREIRRGTFRIHAKLSRSRFSLRGGSEYELLAEADSETFTRGNMAKHMLLDGWEVFHGCGGFR